MQVLARRPGPVPTSQPSGVHGSPLAAYRAAIVLFVVCAACSCLPVADARGHRQAAGPPLGAYPWTGDRRPALDPWGFVARQCTSYAAWYLNAHGVPFRVLTRGPGGRGLFTSAGSWDGAATAAGFPVLATPAVGSIAQWDPGESSPAAPPGAAGDRAAEVETAGRYGHVAVVREVNGDGSVQVSEYNGADGSYHVRTTRAPRYLYLGVPASAAARPGPSSWQQSAAARAEDAGG